MKREAILNSPEYWLCRVQIDIYVVLSDYMRINKLSVADMAKRANVKKKHIKQTLDADFNLSFEALVKIALACHFAPVVQFKPIDEIIKDDLPDRSPE